MLGGGTPEEARSHRGDEVLERDPKLVLGRKC